MRRPRPNDTRRRRAATAALLASSLLVSALLAELALRAVFGAPVHFVHPQESYAFDPEVGHTLVPGDRAYTHAAPVRVNAAGLRGDEIAARPPPRTWRILALGDSQTFGNGLRLSETWPARLERALERRDPGADVQVLNGGISATDTWQHARLLARWIDPLHPDAVVLAFYVNDVTPRHHPTRPPVTNALSQRMAYVLKRSALVTFTWSLARRVAALGEPHADRELRLLRGEEDERIEAGWQEVEASLREMRRLCAERGVPFALAVLPRRDQVDGRIGARAYNRRIAAITGKLGIPTVDLLEPLRRAWESEGDELFIAWDGHNSGRANRVIAAAIARALAPVLHRPEATDAPTPRAATAQRRSAPARDATAERAALPAAP